MATGKPSLSTASSKSRGASTTRRIRSRSSRRQDSLRPQREASYAPINRFPAAAGSSGSGSYFTDPDINPHSQVWQTPARQDQRTGTSQASASSSRLWNFESQETVSPARANETLG